MKNNNKVCANITKGAWPSLTV